MTWPLEARFRRNLQATRTKRERRTRRATAILMRSFLVSVPPLQHSLRLLTRHGLTVVALVRSSPLDLVGLTPTLRGGRQPMKTGRTPRVDPSRAQTLAWPLAVIAVPAQAVRSHRTLASLLAGAGAGEARIRTRRRQRKIRRRARRVTSSLRLL